MRKQTQRYNFRRALPAYTAPWFDIEHQNIQRALTEAQDALRSMDVLSVDDFLWRSDPDDTLAVGRALTEYQASIVTYAPPAPSLNLYAAPTLRFSPRLYQINGTVASTAAAVRMFFDGGALILQLDPTKDTFQFSLVSRVSVMGGQFIGGQRTFFLQNPNWDGSQFDFHGSDFFDTRDYPIVAEPNNPNTTDGTVNHLSGTMTTRGCRWYNTNGILRTFFDLTVVAPGSYATLYSSLTHGPNGRFTARPAIDCRSKGDGLRLEQFFGVALCRNGLDNHRWVDIKPGAVGDPAAGYAGGTEVVSGGGGFSARGCRFGQEEGGIPPVWNWNHGLGRTLSPIMSLSSIVFDDCGEMGGGGGNLAGGGVIVLKQGIPQMIRVDGKGPEDHDTINSRNMVDLAGVPTTLAWWLDPARSPNRRLTVRVEGPRSISTIGAVAVPTELIPFAIVDETENADRRELRFPKLVTGQIATIRDEPTVAYGAAGTKNFVLGVGYWDVAVRGLVDTTQHASARAYVDAAGAVTFFAAGNVGITLTTPAPFTVRVTNGATPQIIFSNFLRKLGL